MLYTQSTHIENRESRLNHYRIEIDNILDLNFLTHNYKCFVSQKQLLKYVF